VIALVCDVSTPETPKKVTRLVKSAADKLRVSL
jgi:hypothetical protein